MMPVIQGHRGARGVYPENTLEGFQYLLDQDIQGTEIDINLSAQGDLIIVHDHCTHADLHRDASDHWIVDDRRWIDLDRSQIATINAGAIRPDSDYARRFPRQRILDRAAVPDYVDLVNLLQSHGSPFHLTIEVKHDPGNLKPDLGFYADRVVETLSRHRFDGSLTVQSFNWAMLRAIRERVPNVILGCLSEQQSDINTITGSDGNDWTDGLRIEDFGGSVPAMVREFGAAYWAPYYPDLNVSLVKEAHQCDLQVCTWTVNDVNCMQKLLIWGVDSIISDYPVTLINNLI